MMEPDVEMQRERRVLYFSDGSMEIADSDSEEAERKEDVPDAVIHDKSTLSRMKLRATKVGTNILAGIDIVGGGLASFLGITTPKYSSEMESYKRSNTINSSTDLTDNGNNTWLRSYEAKNEREEQQRNAITMEPK